MIAVSTATKALVEKHAQHVLAAVRKETPKADFNQDMNAYAVARSLKELGLTWPAEKNGVVLEVLKKGGNASALRQAITQEKKKDEVANEIADELLDMAE